jgi:hypothetical protein
MKKVTLLCGMLLALTATVASAAPGLNLRWLNCLGDAGQANRVFACNVNTGSHLAVGSFEIGADLGQVSGNEIVIDLAAAGPALPAWWQFRNAGTCRQTSLGLNAIISASAVNCFDWANGQAAGGIGAYNVGIAGPNTARIVAALAVPAGALADLFSGQEYFSYNLTINNQKTVGTGACADCLTPVCLVFNSLKLTTPVATNDRTISGPTNGTDSNYATWQGGGNPGSARGTGCPAATPTKSSTWGSVKNLYR